MAQLKHQPQCTTPFIIPITAKRKHCVKIKLLQPPVIVNVREDAKPVPGSIIYNERMSWTMLSEQELNYFKTNGNNATIFIHGFNVPYGQYAQQIKRLFQTRTSMTGQASRNNYNYITADYANTPATVYRTPLSLAKRFPIFNNKMPMDRQLNDTQLNGEAAHKWFIHMEYELNRAAGFDADGDGYEADWTQYTRIINVAWSGDVAAPNYIQAEINANMASQKLVPLLYQLKENGIKINLIAHSLGNRVLLGLLNIAGDAGWNNVVENAFMWEPAVPDTALSNDPKADTSILRNWNFIHAHKAAKHFVVLYSQNDNILGPYADQKGPLDAYPNLPGVADDIYNHINKPDVNEDLTKGDDGRTDYVEGITGSLGSSYKVATQVGVPMFDTSGIRIVPFWNNPAFYLGHIRNLDIEGNYKRYQQELNKIKANDKTGPAVDNLAPYWYEWFAPILYYNRINREVSEDFFNHLRALKNTDIQTISPRQAMGWNGLKAAADTDPFIRQKINEGKFVEVNQTPWLKTHSGMQVPDGETAQMLREKSYRDTIMVRIKESSGFGQY